MASAHQLPAGDGPVVEPPAHVRAAVFDREEATTCSHHKYFAIAVARNGAPFANQTLRGAAIHSSGGRRARIGALRLGHTSRAKIKAPLPACATDVAVVYVSHCGSQPVASS